MADIAPWKRSERIALYRKKINHEAVKGRQLELFNPDDGFWESFKRTTAFLLQTISTIRFEWLGRAARLLRPAGSASLRLADNERVCERIEQKLAQAA